LGPDRKVLLATRSKGKLRELHGILASAGLEGVTLDDAGIAESAEEEHIEIFDTFEENALAKARYFHRRSRMPTMADDSGLSVRALGGAPGVYSKRYSARDDLSLGMVFGNPATRARAIAAQRHSWTTKESWSRWARRMAV
jgi:XTP/dITP diphosphohydrolase